MTIPVNALPASVQHEPALAALPVQKKPALTPEIAALDDVEKTSNPTAIEKNEALDEINQSLRMSSIGVRFEFDKDADMMIAKVVDVDSGDVIRQMPSEEVVHISKILGKLQGLLVSQKV